MPIYVDLAPYVGSAPDYTPTTILGSNVRAEIKIPKTLLGLQAEDNGVLAADYSFVFYTEATPMYASVDYIYLKAGELFMNIPEHAIYLMGYTASTLVDDLVMFDPDEKFQDKTTQSWYLFNRARTEWVSCRAILGFFRMAIASKGLGAGRKMLADFSIDSGALSSIMTTARPLLQEINEQCRYWEQAMFSGGAYDFMAPSMKTAVKSALNTNDNTAGIGRGWTVGGMTLNQRDVSVRAEGSWTRPVRYSDPRYYVSVGITY